MVKIAVSGSNGRMGTRIIRLIKEDDRAELAGGFDINDDPLPVLKNCDVLIEFTSPDATMKNLKLAKDLGRGVVIGTTGLSEEDIAVIKETALSIPVVFSPNMAVGVNLLFELVKQAVAVLDNTFNISISETHHIHKKDAPSGTAKKIRDIIMSANGRVSDDIKMESQRIGEVVGDHTVVLEGKEERLELIHHAKSRDVFARGAIVAARFAVDKDKGFYSMNEVLGIGSQQK